MKWLLVAGLLISTQAFASSRTVMVQLFEWPWADVARECETDLGPNGFAAVQVSPPQESLVTGNSYWWERYQPVSYLLVSRSGDEAGFRDMVNRCHAVGVDIYVDTVLNHTAGIAEGVGIAGTTYTKYNHPGLYGPDDYHYCGRNGNNQIVNFNDRYEVQFCELVGLADLKTESEKVRNTLADYLDHLLDLGVAGFRLDSAKHVPAADLEAIFSRLNRQPKFIVSETFIGPGEPVQVQEYFPLGHVNFFDYAFAVSAAFNNGQISGLPATIANYIDSRKAVVFIENHDLQRSTTSFVLSYAKNPQAYWLANVFMLTWPYGYPQVFSGYNYANFDQGPPVDSNGRGLPVLDANDNCVAPWICEHRLPAIGNLVQFRNFTDSFFSATRIWSGNAGQLAFSRGNLGFVALNSTGQSMTADIQTDLPNGQYPDVIGVNGVLSVQNGWVHVQLAPLQAVVLQANQRLQHQRDPRR